MHVRRNGEAGSRRVGAAGLAQLLGGGLGGGQREVFERTGEHDAVVTLGSGYGHVLVEHVVEHSLGIAVERVAPTAAAAVVVVEQLTSVHRHPLGGVLHDERVIGLIT